MLRTLLLIIIAVLYLIITLPVMAVLAAIGRKNPEKRERTARKMVKWVFRLLTRATGSTVTVRGLENIPKDEPALFIGNHRSIFDIITVYPYIHEPVSFVSKVSIHKIPLLGIWMDFIQSLYFDRSDMKQAMRMILDGTELLKEGTSVFIYPEGTRKKTGNDLPLGEFHEGSFRMLDEALAAEEYGVGFRKDDLTLVENINRVLNEMAADGTLAVISTKWFDSDITTIGKTEAENAEG